MTDKKQEIREMVKLAPSELKTCPRCGRKMSWFEQEDGTMSQWCYWDQSPYLQPPIELNIKGE